MRTSIACLCLLLACSRASGPDTPVVEPEVVSSTWIERPDDPGRPDADDPAIWIDRRQPERSLVLGTLKYAGMSVMTLGGDLVQLIRPPNAKQGAFRDSTSPAASTPCGESESGETFGRFNNVAVAYGFTLDQRAVDLAVLTDRGCDRLRFYRIDRDDEPPLTDVTSTEVARVFPARILQPSPLQGSPGETGVGDNPLDDEDTAYGLGLWQDGDRLHAFVSQRNRSVVAQLRIEPTPGGGVGYSHVRTFRLDPNFTLTCPDRAETLSWTPCRSVAREDPQAEGIVVDPEQRILFVGVENVGVYRIPLRDDMPRVVTIGPEALVDRVRSFGSRYRATPKEDGFLCEYEPSGEAPPDAFVADGCPASKGRHLVADVEGIALRRAADDSGYLIVSSQGDSTLHVYERGGSNRHVGAFRVAGVEETDGLEVAEGAFGARFPRGLLVIQSGRTPANPLTRLYRKMRDRRASHFAFVRWDRVATLLDLQPAPDRAQSLAGPDDVGAPPPPLP